MSEYLTVSAEQGEPEIFSTIQGEGRHLGEPATFIRLSGCNLQCIWCDTPYTWNWTGTNFEHNGDQKFVKENEQITLAVGEAVNRITGETAERVVITGGEPLIQQTNIVELVKQLKEANPNIRVEIETNGSIAPTNALQEQIDQFNVSVKLRNSTMPEKKRLKPRALKTFAEMPNADFKFVIDTPDDLEQVLTLQTDYDIPTDRIYLMPQGVSQEEQVAKSQWVADICKQNNFNFTPRLHIALWGAKRGV
ncbi:7-carboxy-7-deazaguanine synthase QueE [Candidatus Saccharibacteria bacterium]|nr:7-carboxy-7-deazaguanine synthase QueE [Candidatus Saccharibacteria bacterium]